MGNGSRERGTKRVKYRSGQRATQAMMIEKLLSVLVGISLGMFLFGKSALRALPPPEDVPEEVMRTQIILEARSPIDGQLLNAAEYAELQAQLAQSPYPPPLDSEVKQLIFLLQLLHALRTFTPL